MGTSVKDKYRKQVGTGDKQVATYCQPPLVVTDTGTAASAPGARICIFVSLVALHG